MMERIPMTSHAGNEQDRQASRVELLSEKQKAPDRFSWSSITLDTWILEGAFLGFSIACLVSIYGILLAYNGKPRPEFSYKISLNTVVSALATACKSSLVFVVGAGLSQLKWLWFQNRRQLSSIQAFEDASRGPMGSISFLFRHQGQSIASLGATILILMLAFEPFVQQILSYPTEQIRTAINTPAAAVPQVQYYNDLMGVNEETSAYFFGIWAKDFNIEPTCPSGNCTWPGYKSLGLCSQCSDVTSISKLNCAMPPSSHKMGENATLNGTCEVVLPRGRPSATSFEAYIKNGTTASLYCSMKAVWEVERYAVIDGSAYSGIRNPLLVLAQSTLGFDNNLITNSSDPTEGIFIKNVTQCAFTFCVKDYDVHVTNGKVFIDKSSPDFGKTENMTGPDFEGSSSLLCWVPSQTLNDTERHYDVVYPKDRGSMVVGPEFSWCDFYKREYSFVLTGLLLTGTTYDSCVHLDSGWEYAQQRVSLENINKILALGLEVTALRVADSMTKTMLQNSNVTIPGSIYANQVMVRVQWAWMILPTFLVVLGNVFLVWVSCANKKKIIWKSSVLAFLFHGLEDQRERYDSMTASGMEKLAEAMHVQLHPSRDDSRVMLREN